METNNGFHSAGKDREDHIRACSYPEARPPCLPPAYPPKGWGPFSISSHSDSISWGLSLPAQPPRVISTFSSNSGVTAAYRDCANPNKSSWKALPPSLLSLPPPPNWNHRGFLTSWQTDMSLKQEKQVPFPRDEHRSIRMVRSYAFKKPGHSPKQHSWSRRMNNGSRRIDSAWCWNTRAQPVGSHSPTLPPQHPLCSIWRAPCLVYCSFPMLRTGSGAGSGAGNDLLW